MLPWLPDHTIHMEMLNVKLILEILLNKSIADCSTLIVSYVMSTHGFCLVS